MPSANPFSPWEYPDYEPGTGSDEPPLPGSPVLTINLMISAGTLDPRVDAPGFIPGSGTITAQAARDLITAGSANRASRWPRQTPAPPGPPGPEVREFITSLNLTMQPLATQPGEHGHTEPGHDPSRALRHLIEARNATCATPGCDTPAVSCDMEHRIAYENNGPTSEGNLDPATHGHCHRLKQNNQWTVTKTSPTETTWTGPSGRKRTVRPTRYLL